MRQRLGAFGIDCEGDDSAGDSSKKPAVVARGDARAGVALEVEDELTILESRRVRPLAFDGISIFHSLEDYRWNGWLIFSVLKLGDVFCVRNFRQPTDRL